MPFAFGQKINLSQQNIRTGISSIKWGFCTDDPVTGGILSRTRVAGIETASLMHIQDRQNCATTAVPPEGSGPSEGGTAGFIYGSEACCIGAFDDVTDVTSGNNIDSITQSWTEERWRNIEIPPNAQEIKLYIQTKSGDPSNVIHNDLYDCAVSSSCFHDTGKSIDCTECAANNCEDGYPCIGCGTNYCNNLCSCCPRLARPGGTAGNYVVTIGLSGCTQETLYCYTAWFNGAGEQERTGITASVTNRCRDNIRVALFPKLPGTPDYPYFNMSDTYAMVTTYKGNNAYEFLNQPFSFRNCTCVNLPGVSGTCTSCAHECFTCVVGSCAPVPSRGGNAAISTYAKDAGISITVEATGTAEFWGQNGDGSGSPSGYWNDVFGWNAVQGVSFESEYFGGEGGSACTVVGGPDADYTCPTGSTGPNRTYDNIGPSGCSCESINDFGGQIIGYSVR
jgi:hypothetical protein